MNARLILLLLASLLVGLVAVSHQSFWIDEPYTARYAMQPSIAGWWHLLSTSDAPDIQMVVYTFWLWVWERIFGASEYALRAANIPWFLLAQAALWRGLRRWPRVRSAALLFNAFNPLLWRYLDEVRPFGMEYCGAAMVIACLCWLAADDEAGAAWVFSFGGGLFVLCSSISLGVVWAFAAVLAACFLLWRGKRILWSRGSIFACALWLTALAALAGYYLHVSSSGAGGHRKEGNEFQGLCFAAYELAGLDGLGPGRNQIWDALSENAFFPYMPMLVLAAVLLAGQMILAVRAFHRHAAGLLKAVAAIYLFLPLGVILPAVVLAQWQAKGRHFMPDSPVVAIAAALAMAAALRERSGWRVGWSAAFFLAWVTSCLELRFAPRHLRDDYRHAAQIAKESLAKREHVWWVASTVAGDYYGVPFTSDPKQEGKSLCWWRPEPAELAAAPAPNCVILSKPRLFDTGNAVVPYLAAGHYQKAETFPGFDVWVK